MSTEQQRRIEAMQGHSSLSNYYSVQSPSITSDRSYAFCAGAPSEHGSLAVLPTCSALVNRRLISSAASPADIPASEPHGMMPDGSRHKTQTQPPPALLPYHVHLPAAINRLDTAGKAVCECHDGTTSSVQALFLGLRIESTYFCLGRTSTCRDDMQCGTSSSTLTPTWAST